MPLAENENNDAGDRMEVCSICGARNIKNDGASYTEAHRAREHRVNDRIVALEQRVAALEALTGPCR